MKMRMYPALVFGLSLGMFQAVHATSPAPAPLGSGYSAVWYDAQNPGTGWVLEMLNGDRAAAYWYGFDDQGQPVWRTGGGTQERDSLAAFYLAFDELYAGSGARWGEAFNPQDVELAPTGGAEFRFSSCNAGSVTLDPEGAASVEPLDRLTRTMAAGCAPLNGVPGFPVMPYAGQSGTWYDPERSGEGISLQWMARDEAALYWFTYDLQGNPLWLFGVGQPANGAIEFPVVYTARRSGNGEVQLSNWGSLSLELQCSTGMLNWSSGVAGYGAGSRELTRLNTLASPSCPYLAPTFTDLYAVDVLELPVPAGREILAKSIANDGTVLGIEEADDHWAALVLAPGSTTWTALEGSFVNPDQVVLIAPGAERAVAAEPTDADDETFQPIEWTPDGGWVPVPGFDPGAYELTFGSNDRSVLTGFTPQEDPGSPNTAWVWNAAEGLQMLPPLGEGSMGAVAMAASNSGQRVIGFQNYPVVTPPPEAGHQAGAGAIRWVDGAAQQLLDDQGRELVIATACSADCDIVYGRDTNGVERDSPRINQPWLWTADGRFGVFEALVYDGGTVHDVLATSADGTLALGYSYTPSPFPVVGLQGEAFLWTQATGVVYVADLFGELGIMTSPPATSGFDALALSADGRRILLEQNDSGGRAVVIHLAPAP